MKPRRRWLWGVAVLVAATAVLPVALFHGGLFSGSPGGASGLVADFLDLNGSQPGGHIIFGSPLPVAEIRSDEDAAVGATLGLDHLLEIAPNASDPEHPTVVAEAAPETLQQFNSTVSSHGTPYLKLIATLPVFPADTVLWTNGTTILPASTAPKQAILEVNYTVTSGSDGSPGVLVSWTVSGWPWVNPGGDELALEYVVQVVSGSGFSTCSGPPSTDAPSATCAREPLDQGQAVWSSALTALKGYGPNGSVSWVSWGSQVGGSNAVPTSVSAGAFYERPGTSALVIAAPTGGATSVMGSTLFLLSPGTVAALFGPLVGNLPAYGGAAAAFAAAAGLGVWFSRRRDATLVRELAA